MLFESSYISLEVWKPGKVRPKQDRKCNKVIKSETPELLKSNLLNTKRSHFFSFVQNERTSKITMAWHLSQICGCAQICCLSLLLFWHHRFQYNEFSEIFAYPAYFKENSSRLDIDHNPPFSRICMLIQFIFYSQYFRSMGFLAAFTIKIIRSDVCPKQEYRNGSIFFWFFFLLNLYANPALPWMWQASPQDPWNKIWSGSYTWLELNNQGLESGRFDNWKLGS